MGLEFGLEFPTHQEETVYDVAIIGGGPAGTTAAIYTARANLKTLVIDKGLTAGALGITSKIANYPGIPEEISGAELLRRMRQQAQQFGAEFVQDKIQGCELERDPKVLYGNNGTYLARAVIIATGSMGRGNRVPGEDRLLGRGVSYCATCDAAFFRDQEVVVAGNNDEAIEEALFLTRFVRRVHFLSPTPDLKAPADLAEELLHHPKVTFYPGAVLKEILGEERVEGVRFRQRGQPEQTLPVSGAFIYLQGGQPITDFLQGQLPLSETGCLIVDREFQTAIPGVFAVGDVLCNHVKQAVVAAAEGAIAAMAVEKRLRGREKLAVDWSK
ncbi:FAD-dependent oxidoreductase [uncultured Thermanaerothrix sp.]|uniref:NAD(P)/FAD-dependent oxidoreductase n=1 Tax=uncultured Thermanaerothrix sp. TaxID=1195149 RepID=UPI00262316E7|nr:FAD-dependent oxidoreductase [uncultured Thermanaerothrix sp.]